MRVRDLNWMQLEEYLARDDRVLLPVGSTEQHAYLSLETDNIIAERLAVEAAEPLGVPVLPVLAYGLTQGFAAAYPGSPTLRLATYAAVLCDLLDSLHGQGFRRFFIANGHGGNTPGAVAAAEWRRTVRWGPGGDQRQSADAARRPAPPAYPTATRATSGQKRSSPSTCQSFGAIYSVLRPERS